MPDFTAVYAELHRILAPYAAKLHAKTDDGTELYVDTRHIQKNSTDSDPGPRARQIRMRSMDRGFPG